MKEDYSQPQYGEEQKKEQSEDLVTNHMQIEVAMKMGFDTDEKLEEWITLHSKNFADLIHEMPHLHVLFRENKEDFLAQTIEELIRRTIH